MVLDQELEEAGVGELLLDTLLKEPLMDVKTVKDSFVRCFALQRCSRLIYF